MAAMLANPFYAIEIHSSLSRPHSYFFTEAEWVRSNGLAVEEIGKEAWLGRLLTALKADHGNEGHMVGPPAVADPYDVLRVANALCEPHSPLISEELWIRANVRGLGDDAAGWLRNLLSVLRGAYVASGGLIESPAFLRCATASPAPCQADRPVLHRS